MVLGLIENVTRGMVEKSYGISQIFMKYRIKSKFAQHVVRYSAQNDQLSKPVYRKNTEGVRMKSVEVISTKIGKTPTQNFTYIRMQFTTSF